MEARTVANDDPQTFPSEETAASDIRDTIARILACIDRRIVVVGSPPDATNWRTLTIAGGSAHPLRTAGGGTNLALRMTMLFQTVPVGNRWRTHTQAYYYTLEDLTGTKIISWEWHPHAREAGERIITHPHLHVAAGAGRALRHEFSRAHLVTNRVALQRVAEILIRCESGCMSKAYSDDLRARIVRAVEDEGMSQVQVAARFAVGLASVKRYLHQWRTTGDLTPRPRPGRPRAIPRTAQDRLVALLAADPDATLAMYCARWEAETGVAVSASTLCRAQQRVGWTVKKSR